MSTKCPASEETSGVSGFEDAGLGCSSLGDQIGEKLDIYIQYEHDEYHQNLEFSLFF